MAYMTTGKCLVGRSFLEMETKKTNMTLLSPLYCDCCCVVLGALCSVLSSAAVIKVCRDGQTAGCCRLFDRKCLLVSTR